MNKIVYIHSFEELSSIAPPSNAYIITDENIEMLYHDAMKPWKSIVIPPGEDAKEWSVIDNVIVELLALNADRDTTIIAIGGGVVTDIAGFVAAIYKRGVRCVLMPTSILAMVDAAIGGKNGINVRQYKNMIGTISVPEATIYHLDLLNTLPYEEWINGFAEIIKHSLIADQRMYHKLGEHNIEFWQKNKDDLQKLIHQNIAIKNKLIADDLHEKGNRKLLNFGHTLGHAIEKSYALPHGHAIAIGMVFAARISDDYYGTDNAPRVIRLLNQYGLPTEMTLDKDVIWMNLAKDKKRFAQHIDFILLKNIGDATITSLSMDEVKHYIHVFIK